MTIKDEILRRFKIEDIKQHNANTLDFVGVALNFVYPYIGNIEQAFYSEIFQQFPERTINPMKEHTLQISNEGLNMNKVSIEEKASVNYVYYDENGKFQLLLNHETLDFQCINPRQNYSDFKKFSETFRRLYSCLVKVTSDYNKDINVKNKALFVRKINRLSYNTETLSRLNSDYIKEINLLKDCGISIMEPTRFYSEIFSQEDDGTKIVIRNGSSLNQDRQAKSLIYDFQVFKDNPSRLNANMEEDLNNFSTIIYNLYRHMLGDKFFSSLGD